MTASTAFNVFFFNEFRDPDKKTMPNLMSGTEEKSFKYFFLFLIFIAEYVCTYKKSVLVTEASSTPRQHQHTDDKK